MDITIASRRMSELFTVDSFIQSYDKVFVNLDAMLNTIMYPDVLDDLFLDTESANTYCSDVAGMIKVFVSKVINRSVIFYHSDDDLIEDRRISKIDKCLRERVRNLHNHGVALVIKKFFMQAITKLAANSNGKVKVFNMKDLEPTLFVSVYVEIFKPSRVLVVSRDQVDLCLLSNNNVDIWDGVTLISNKSFESHMSKKIPIDIPQKFIPLYLTIKGVYSLDWGGIPMVGPKKARQFIVDAGVKLLDDDYLIEFGVNIDLYNCLDTKRYFKNFPDDKVRIVQIMKGD
ncbi:MAG: hypothetical protein ACRCZ9_12260 [Fusobacteriaceae bacterium]